jgi:hypothetical protein
MLGVAARRVKVRGQSQPDRNAGVTGAALTPGRPGRTLATMESLEPISVERDFTAFSVRDGRLAPVTCVACGCRLERHADGSWWHFSGRGERDARGCIVACAEQPHYAPGGIAAALG